MILIHVYKWWSDLEWVILPIIMEKGCSSQDQQHHTTNVEAVLGSLDSQSGTPKRRRRERIFSQNLSTSNDADVEFLQSLPNVVGEVSTPTTQVCSPSHEHVRGLQQKFRCPCYQCAPKLTPVYKYADQCQSDIMKFGIHPNSTVFLFHSISFLHFQLQNLCDHIYFEYLLFIHKTVYKYFIHG